MRFNHLVDYIINLIMQRPKMSKPDSFDDVKIPVGLSETDLIAGRPPGAFLSKTH